MMLSFVTPELILAVSLFLLFLNAFRVIGLGTNAQLVGLVVLSLAYPVVIVRARMLSLGDSFEEAAMDLGASPARTLSGSRCRCWGRRSSPVPRSCSPSRWTTS